jgi:signal transduction histidine kinase/DNA-binding response OmpR family regulator
LKKPQTPQEITILILQNNTVNIQEISGMSIALIVLCAALVILPCIILIRTIAGKRKADERIQTMFDSTPLCAYLWNKDYKIIDCNQVAVTLYDLSSKQEYCDRFNDLSPEYQPDGRSSIEKAKEYIDKGFKDGYCRFEWMHQKLNGELIPSEITLVRIQYGGETFVAGYTRDLREQKTAIEKIREAEETKKAMFILENILDGLDENIHVTVPETGEILFMNNNMKKEYGIEGDCVGKICYKILHDGQDGICEFCPCHQLDKNGGSAIRWIGDYSKTKRTYSNTDSYIQWPGGRMAHLQYSVDITELNEAKEQAVQARAAMSGFLAKISHEIRTPLNAVLGITEIQLQSDKLPANTRDALHKISDSGYLLLHIINDLLDLTKIEAGKLELIPVNYQIASLINDTAHLNIMRIDYKPLKFILQVDENIPSILFGDELRIKQILNNLLSNAFKYTENGEILLSVSFEHDKGGDPDRIMLVFRVSDTGQGMSQEQVDKLFTEYTRFNMESNRVVEGTGLGLSITKILVQMMGGEISVESEAGKGTVFTVRIPQVKVDSKVLGTGAAKNLQKLKFGKTTQMETTVQIIRDYMPYGRVLIVDDVETNLYVARGLMTPYGLSIETAESGFEAVDKIKSGSSYDIIFMDHFMPKMDGVETTKVIRELGYTRPIVALTANALIGQAEMFIGNGFEGFISKPIDMRQLNSILNKLVRDKHSKEEVDSARRLKDSLRSRSAAVEAPLPTSSQLVDFFTRDAQKAIATLEDIHANNYRRNSDIQMFIISVHAMKSALANIGEPGLAEAASRLEQAGREKDTGVMASALPSFLKHLKAVVKKISLKEDDENVEITDEEQVYLRKKLLILQESCAGYDKKTAKDILAELREKTWPRSVREMLNAIAAHLLHSDFDEAASAAGEYANK